MCWRRLRTLVPIASAIRVMTARPAMLMGRGSTSVGWPSTIPVCATWSPQAIMATVVMPSAVTSVAQATGCDRAAATA